MFETELLTQDENLTRLAAINRELLAKVEAMESARRVVVDIDSTEIPVYGQQEQSAYNGHFEAICYQPLLLFNREGDCLAAKLRPGNVHSAEHEPGSTEEGVQVSNWKSQVNNVQVCQKAIEMR